MNNLVCVCVCVRTPWAGSLCPLLLPCSMFLFVVASLLGFWASFGAPLCHVVGGLNPSITPLSRKRQSSHETCIHLFCAAGRFCPHVWAIIRLAWERCNSEFSSRGIFGHLVHCSLLSLTPWHSSAGICSADLQSALHSLFLSWSKIMFTIYVWCSLEVLKPFWCEGFICFWSSRVRMCNFQHFASICLM